VPLHTSENFIHGASILHARHRASSGQSQAVAKDLMAHRTFMRAIAPASASRRQSPKIKWRIEKVPGRRLRRRQLRRHLLLFRCAIP
jgi:hypothetical protein